MVYHLFIRKDERQRMMADLRAVKHEDIPYVMVSLLERIKERGYEQKIRNKHEHEAKEGDNSCVACYEVIPSIKNQPCGHVVLCSRCNWHLIRVSIENRTPLICSWCRTPVKDFEGELRPNLDLIEWKDIKDALTDLKFRKLGKNIVRNNYRIQH